MTLNKHIRRNYNANKTKIIRYGDDKFRFEIFKYDKTREMLYTIPKNNFKHNGYKKWFDGMTGIKSGITSNRFTYHMTRPTKTVRLGTSIWSNMGRPRMKRGFRCSTSVLPLTRIIRFHCSMRNIPAPSQTFRSSHTWSIRSENIITRKSDLSSTADISVRTTSITWMKTVIHSSS